MNLNGLALPGIRKDIWVDPQEVLDKFEKVVGVVVLYYSVKTVTFIIL